MAYFRIEYFSNALHRTTSFEMLIPNDDRMGRPNDEAIYGEYPLKTLFLLHGYTGKAGNWVPEGLPEQYHFAIVMPTAENSFFLNGLSTGHAFQTMVGQELVEYVRKTFHLDMTPEDTAIAGLSMGGFGALHTGLAYPENFAKIGGLSSGFIVHQIAHMKPGQRNSTANYEYYHECFGDLETVEESENNPEVQVRKLKKEGRRIPDIYLCCGTEDSLLGVNRDMHRFLTNENVPHIYREGPGRHDMVFWHEHIAKIVAWMFG